MTNPEQFKPRKINHAFTLIELLVVVALISVLAALLLPALRTARDRAKRTQCSSSFRQLLTGAFVFANDKNGLLPSLNSQLIYPDMGWIDASLYPFYSQYLGLTISNNAAGRCLVPKLLVCPGIAYNDLNLSANLGDGVYLRRIGDAIYPGPACYRVGFSSFLGISSGDDIMARGIGVHLGQLTAASSEVLLFDSLTQRTVSPYIWLIPHGRNNRADGLNQGYADGSVRWSNWKEVNRYFIPELNGQLQINYYYYCPPTAKFNLGGYPPDPVASKWDDTPWNWVGVTTLDGGAYTPH